MPNLNSLLSENAAVVATVDPDVLTAADHDSDWVDMGEYNRIAAIVMAGTLGSSATMDAILQQATDSSGTGVKAITGKAITQLTDAGTDSDKQAIMNCRADELDVANSFRFVRLRITVAVASSDGAGLIIADGKRHGSADSGDLATVDEIVG
jgi:hypothetical protein